MKKFLLIIFIFLFISIVIFMLQKQNNTSYGYNKFEIITIHELLTNQDPDHWKNIHINNNGDIAYKNKVVFKDNGEPLNENNAYTTLEMKIIISAKHIEPNKNCNPVDNLTNGTMGCYTDNPD